MKSHNRNLIAFVSAWFVVNTLIFYISRIIISETIVTFKETQISASMVKAVLRYVWCGDMVMI